MAFAHNGLRKLSMKRLYLNLKLTSVIITLAGGVLLPVILSTVVGIIALAFADDAQSIIMGVLVISFTLTAAGSALIAVVLTSKKARLARRQADFIASVSHEFRTPLSAIRLYVQTLQSGKLADNPEQSDKCLATILRETEWLGLMVDRAITWRASSRDLLTLNLQEAPLSQAVNNAVERFRTMTDPDELSLSACIDTHLNVHHDPDAVQGIMLNLLSNAYKYTGKQKQIRVTVSDREDEVVIRVEDNGIGMTASEMKHVFKPFYRTDQQRAGDSGGVGLGLSIAQHLVNQQKGSITIDSRPGEGSTFAIHLPAAAAE
jgi:two-component system phosphate regulon sensor histidine kinase PhoR